MATARTFTAGRFALTLDGVACGFVESVEGGDVVAELVEEPGGASFFTKKRIGRVKIEELSVQAGLDLAQPVFDWIAASWRGDFQRKDGSITTADVNLNAQAERQFLQALVTEVAMPALDAASKDAARLTVSFLPESVKDAKATGKVAGPANAKQQRFVASNFRLELDGVDCKSVRKIDSFVVQTPTVDAGRLDREPGKPTRVVFPDLRVTLGDGPPAASWSSWFEDFVLKGNNDDSKEKSGAIVYLSPDRKSELGRVVLHNVGIYALRHGRRSAKDEGPRVLTADLYCERMELVVGKPAPQPKPVRPVLTPVRPLGIRR